MKRQRARASEQQSVYVNIARYNKTQVLADFDARRGKERKRENKPQIVLSKHLKDTKHIPVLFALRARIYIYIEREREMTLQT
jgi:hypothetical protein